MIFFTLSHGFSINNIDNRFITIQKLYIKLDKKFILDAQNIKLNFTNELKENNTSINEEEIQTNLLKYMSKFNFINEVFSVINIRNLEYKNTNTSIYFKDNNFKINNELFYANIDIQKEKNILNIKTKELSIKQYEIDASIDLKVNLRLQQYNMLVNVKSDYLTGVFNISRLKDDVSIQISNLKVNNINKLKNMFLSEIKMPSKVVEWVFYRAVGQTYTLDDTKISFNLKQPFNLSTLNLTAHAYDVSVRFNDNAKKANIKHVKVDIKNNGVFISYDSGIYNNTTLSQGGVDIINALTGKNIIVKIKLSGKNIGLDKDVLEVLKAYQIDTGVSVTNAKSDVKLVISIDTNTNKVDVNLDTKLTSGILQPLELTLNNATATIKNNHLYINGQASRKNINSSVTADFDLTKRLANFDLKNTNIDYGDYFTLKNHDINFTLDFNSNPKIQIQKFKTTIDISKAVEIDIKDLMLFANYSNFLQKLQLKSAKAKVDYQNDLYEVIVSDIELDEGFLYLNDKPYKSKKITINYSDKFLNVVDSEKNIFINEEKNKNISMNINNIEIKQNKYLDDFINLSKKEEKSQKTYTIKANNIKIFLSDLQKYIILNNLELTKIAQTQINAQIFIPNNPNIMANAQVKQSDEEIYLNIKNITPDFLNYISGKEVFKDGSFSFVLKGKDLNNYNASFYLYGTLLKGYKTYQRILTYINAVPNLLVFKSSNLSEKGFVVNNGKVDITKQNDIYVFTDINFTGSSADIKGSGVYDAKYQDINLILDLITMKSISSIITSTPIVKQIIMGDKQQISTRLKVSGNIENVEVSSELATEMATSPFTIIKNIVTLPINIFK